MTVQRLKAAAGSHRPDPRGGRPPGDPPAPHLGRRAGAHGRYADTSFAADHFRTPLRYGPERPERPDPEPEGRTPSGGPGEVALDPGEDLYGPLLFQGGRFQRLASYHRVAAREVDAAMRDALMPATQVCMPGTTHVYDTAVHAQDGTGVERWQGLRLRAVRKTGGRGPWAPPLLGPYVERTRRRPNDRPEFAVTIEGEGHGRH